MHEMIRERRGSEKRDERYDLFSSLLDANEMEEPGSEKLLDSELIGEFRLASATRIGKKLTDTRWRQHVFIPPGW